MRRALLSLALLLPSLARAQATSTTSPELGGRPMTPFEQELMRHSFERYTGDLAVLKQKKVLRVLTRNNSSAYFISNGQERGFQYELAKTFADELGLRLAVIVPSSRSELEKALLEGEGDLVAADVTITEDRAERLSFTHPVRRSPRVLVTKAKSKKPVASEEDLTKLAIHVSFRSTTYGALKAIEARIGKPLTLHDVTDDVEMEEMMERVSAGTYEATIADRDLFDLSAASGLAIAAPIEIASPIEKGWAVRKDAPELARLASAFIARSSKDGLMKILHDRYFKSARAAKNAKDLAFRADEKGKISRYDEIFKREGARVGLDWRLLAAVAFSESRFDPNAKSDWGAIGLMQVLPSTGKAMGVTRLEDPAENIKAGASYLRYLVDRFDDPKIEMRQRIRFALASYNAGLGHVFDARALAEKISKNKNAWFGNVEQALKLKRDRKWHEQTKYGFCRADETVGYVSKVQASFDVFARHTR